MKRFTTEGCDIPDGITEEMLPLYRALKWYEDNNSAGRIIKIRAAIGETVYSIKSGKVEELTVCYIYINSNNRIRYYAQNDSVKINFRNPSFGRDIFFSREKAERRLADQ